MATDPKKTLQAAAERTAATKPEGKPKGWVNKPRVGTAAARKSKKGD